MNKIRNNIDIKTKKRGKGKEKKEEKKERRKERKEIILN
jgi:hypothetical protein